MNHDALHKKCEVDSEFYGSFFLHPAKSHPDIFTSHYDESERMYA